MALIDFHTHVIPWADHGSSSVETSLFQLSSAFEAGVDTVVATPHFYPQYENAEKFLTRRNACYERLKEHLTDEHPSVVLGAEILICDNIETMPSLEQLCIEGTRILLIELPFTDFSDSFVYSIKMLIRQGYTVVLAHADRYSPSNIDRLVAAGAKIQLNVDSLSGFFMQPHVRRWVDDRRVVALGSDIHGSDKKAYKRFEKALRRLGDASDYIMSKSETLLITT